MMMEDQLTTDKLYPIHDLFYSLRNHQFIVSSSPRLTSVDYDLDNGNSKKQETVPFERNNSNDNPTTQMTTIKVSAKDLKTVLLFHSVC
ncbi:unnamed protein product [Heterobilharzia americana]|nr:unnamed protein product [Heterobilharzia americana]